jgi:transglutaminase-like putative cysteine protease
MIYQIQHITRLRYSEGISESVMEVYMQPRTESNQRCLRFKVTTFPSARVQSYPDYLGNLVHFFTIPGMHTQLTIYAESLVEILPPSPLPDALSVAEWSALDNATTQQDFFDMLMPTERVSFSPSLVAFAQELGIERRTDPLSVLRQLNTAIHQAFVYQPDSTEVDSPIDVAISTRRGVCQDFTHIMLALTRRLGIPSRYVSGYLFYQKESDRQTPDESHAWVEAWLPSTGWIGFDPTNNVMAGERHIRVAIGRDYTDVPPNKGVFKGVADSDLRVEVKINQGDQSTPIEALMPPGDWAQLKTGEYSSSVAQDIEAQQQQQQQQ